MTPGKSIITLLIQKSARPRRCLLFKGRWSKITIQTIIFGQLKSISMKNHENSSERGLSMNLIPLALLEDRQ